MPIRAVTAMSGAGAPSAGSRTTSAPRVTSTPFCARVIAIADAYDTITSERTYKRPRPAEEALAELERCGGTQFDPELVRVFVEAVRHLPKRTLEGSDLPAKQSTP